MNLSGIRSLNELQVEGKVVFVRVDFNVPMDGSKISDDARIRAAVPTIENLRQRGAVVVLGSHFGRPKGERNEKYSLVPVAERLQQLLASDVVFTDDCVGDGVRKVIKDAKPGDVVLLENLRFHQAEEKNDPLFAKDLASLADVYVNDAFGASHRKHASTYAMVEHFDANNRAMGLLVQREMDFLAPLLSQPAHPYVGIMGGSKVSDKIKVIENLIGRLDWLLIGGAMAYTFLAAQDISIGKSLVESDKLDLARRLLDRAAKSNTKIVLPLDHGVAPEFGSDDRRDTNGVQIPSDMMALDIGPETVAKFQEVIATAKTIIWNGPVGLFERDAYSVGTFAVANAVANNTKAVSVIGGGDSAAAIVAAGRAEDVSHVSTGGGASLEFLEGKELPGIAALRAGHKFTA